MGGRTNTPQIHWLDVARSEAIEAKILQRAEGLSRYSEDIQRLEVWVEASSGHHRKGDLYAIRVRLTVPGEQIAIDLQPREADVNVSIRQAFDAARRKLQDFERRRRADVKTHPRSAQGASRRAS